MLVRLEQLKSPIGVVLLATDEAGAVRALDFKGFEKRFKRFIERHCGRDATAEKRRGPASIPSALTAYFDGDLTAINTVPIASIGTTFQRKMWMALRKIPAGTTLAYGAFAKRIRRPTAIRAVGAANGANPISIIVPCHRLVGADGSLTGYGGGLKRKRWLIDHEKKYRCRDE